MADFERALSEVKPAFGAVTETLEQYRLNGMVDSGEHFRHLQSTCRNLVEQVLCCSLTDTMLPFDWHCFSLSLALLAPLTGAAFIFGWHCFLPLNGTADPFDWGCFSLGLALLVLHSCIHALLSRF